MDRIREVCSRLLECDIILNRQRVGWWDAIGVDDDPVRANRAYWNTISDQYQATHDPQIGRAPKLWGAWSIPEQEVNALGPVADLTVLELGCGAARWAMALEADGAFAVGLDLSDRQLAAARHLSGRLPLVQAAGQTLPPNEKPTIPAVQSDRSVGPS